MKFNPNIHRRKSIRLKDYDYSKEGLYFITIIVKGRECYLSNIINNCIVLSDSGIIVNNYLNEIPNRFNQIKLNNYVIMPNHIHLIVEILPELNNVKSKVILPLPENNSLLERNKRRKMLIAKLIGWLKMNTAKEINIIYQIPGGSFWHRDYYDHIIRDEHSYKKISDYIINNPSNWDKDELYKNQI